MTLPSQLRLSEQQTQQTAVEQTQSPRVLSAQELRNIGNTLSYQQKRITIAQHTVDETKAKIQYDRDRGYDTTKLQIKLDRQLASLAERKAAYNETANLAGENYGAAVRAAPKQYRDDLDPTTGEQKFVYTGTTSDGRTYTTSNLQFIIDKQKAIIGNTKQASIVTGVNRARINTNQVLEPKKQPLTREEKVFYERNPSLQPGVYIGGKGEQVIIKSGGRASNAGELVRSIREGPYNPAPLPYPKGKIIGVVKEDVIDLGPQELTITTSEGTITNINKIPKDLIYGSSSILSENNRNINISGSNRLENFEKEIESQQKRQREFEQSAGQQRIKDTASLITFGQGVPRNERGFFGRFSESLIYSGLNLGIGAGGAIGSAGEKVYLYGKGLTISEVRPQILPSLKENVGKTKNQLVMQLSDPAEAASFGVQVAFFGALGYENAKTSFPVRTAMKAIYPDKFITEEASGLTFVEAVTVPTKLSELRTFEGQSNVPTTHVTAANLPSEFITKSQPGAGPFRQNNQLFQFYKSSPATTPEGLSPRAYLGYVGIVKEATEASSGRVIYGNPTIKVLRFEDTITPTPRSLNAESIQTINQYQGRQSGQTFVPAENIAKASTEGQFITPAKYVIEEKGFFKTTETPIKGYEDFPGSKIIQTEESKFFYYRQQLPKFLGIIPRSRYFKFEIRPSATLPIERTTTIPSETIDLASYNEAFQSSNTRISQPPSAAFLSLGVGSTISTQPSAASKPYYRTSTSLSVNSQRSSKLSSFAKQSSPSSSSSSSNSLTSTTPSSPSPRSSAPRSSSPRFSSPPTSNPSLNPSPSVSITSTPATLRPKESSPLSFEISPKKKKKRKAFDLFLKRRGKLVKENTNLSEGEALSLGYLKTRGSLSATFKITEAGSVEKEKEVTPPVDFNKYFREYKIRGGKKIPTPGEFIQKRRTRLGTPEEIFAIQRARTEV